jgi:hypothetical protein
MTYATSVAWLIVCVRLCVVFVPMSYSTPRGSQSMKWLILDLLALPELKLIGAHGNGAMERKDEWRWAPRSIL